MVRQKKSPEHILTYTGRHFDPTEPRAEDIVIEDIAHALSMMARANGHFKTFYSVAQHCVNCCLEAKARGLSEKLQLACLLHDASEAYLADITRPVKTKLPQYRFYEQNMQETVCRVFDLDDLSKDDHAQVREIDDAFLCYEFNSLYGGGYFPDDPVIQSVPDMAEHGHSHVESRFLSLFNRLTGRRGRKYIGIDGCSGGWICAVLENGVPGYFRYKTIADAGLAHGDFSECLIDIPIGLQSRLEQVRPDAFARKRIRERASTIFPTPCRQAVYADTVNQAYIENERVLGKKFTPLTVGLLPKIKEVDTYLQDNSTLKNRLLESHPEVCFAQLGGKTVLSRKHTPEGQAERITLLERFCPTVRSVNFAQQARLLKCGIDDLLDALCLAVSAALVAEGHSMTLPGTPEADDTGILMMMTVPAVSAPGKY